MNPDLYFSVAHKKECLTIEFSRDRAHSGRATSRPVYSTEVLPSGCVLYSLGSHSSPGYTRRCFRFGRSAPVDPDSYSADVIFQDAPGADTIAAVRADYAGPQGELAGVDQMNVRLPKSLEGIGR